MSEFIGNRVNSALMRLLSILFVAFVLSVTALCVAFVLSIAACKQQTATSQAGPKTFASPQEAGKALADAAMSQNQNEISQIFSSGSETVLSSGAAAEDKASLDGFAKAYQVMNRWRKLDDSTELLLVGADNHAFPIPLMKDATGRWYFDVAAGKEELLARRIGQDEIAAIAACVEIADAQNQYFSQKHDGVKQYAQKFVSDPGQQNGLYWNSPEGSPRSPIGPVVAYATAEGHNLDPKQYLPFYGYYFSPLNKQGADAKGGAEDYIVNGKMTHGFAVVAYPAQYGDSGIMTFIINQDGTLFQKDLGSSTDQVASAMTEFNPDKTWTEVD
jgi:hypothetical protein